MTDKVELEIAILRAGKTKGDLADALGITRMGLHKKINNRAEFKASEIETIRQFLSLSNDDRDKIFFTQKDE